MAVRFASAYTDEGRKVRVVFFFADSKEEATEWIKSAEEWGYGEPCRFLAPSEQSMSEAGKPPTKVWVIRKEECL